MKISHGNGWQSILQRIREKRPLTTFEVSRICGVVHGTVSKWIDEGKLSAYKTPGGHRRVQVSDLMIFLKIYNIPAPPEIAEHVPVKILVLQEDANLSETLAHVLKESFPECEVAVIPLPKPLDLHKLKEAVKKLLESGQIANG